MNPCDKCQHAHNTCVPAHAVLCTRFLPKEGTNLVKFQGIVEVQPDIDHEKFNDLLVDWVEDNGWLMCSMVQPYQEKPPKKG